MSPSQPTKSVASVILRHDTPDGGSHFDWMIRLESGRLMTFRVDTRPDEATDRFEATRLVDHRAAYLDYEGEISGGRGRVTRVARGEVRLLELAEDRVVVEGWYAAADGTGLRRTSRWTGRRVNADLWEFARMGAKGK
ncbi:MAG: hypothetical protein IT434_10635 [Phycisphaerales bacterium]|nr:hypothetical protein [Phycisphaerales bacterium]